MRGEVEGRVQGNSSRPARRSLALQHPNNG